MMATMFLLSSPFFYCVCCRCHCGSSVTVPSASGLYPEVATQRVLYDVSRARDAECNVLKNHRHLIALTGVFVSSVLSLSPTRYTYVKNTLSDPGGHRQSLQRTTCPPPPLASFQVYPYVAACADGGPRSLVGCRLQHRKHDRAARRPAYDHVLL